ncbi:MAG: hypothetical protein KAQ65_07980 [Candidatus Thorarchaeota archaeon]|nr:hypothetical protein [Candidatus Thorarchaeota archaeon]
MVSPAVNLPLISDSEYLTPRVGDDFYYKRVNKVKMSSFELPRSAIIVLDRLTNDGPMTPKDISSRVDLAPRTVSFALRKLIGQKLCKKIPNLRDMRQPLYLADSEKAQELRMKYDHVFRQVLM